MAKATAYSVCDLCRERHARGAPHIWKLQAHPEPLARPVAKVPAGGLPRSVPKARATKGGDLIAPLGVCEWCDRRRAYTAAAMKASRKRK